MASLSKQVLFGTFWSLTGQFGSMFVALVTNVILARLLTPFEFGQIGIIMFFVIVANVLTEGGMGGALVRTENVTKEDYSTVFVFNLIMSVTCFMLLFLVSGLISDFYGDPSLQYLIVASSAVLIINAFQITQNARLMRELKYKRRSLYRFTSIFLSSCIGIYFAYRGLGVWSLVMIQLLTSVFNTILLWYYEGVFFSLKFTLGAFKKLYKFGVNTTFASLIDTAFDNIYQLIIGRYFSISQVGYFYQAKKLQEVPVGVIKSTTLGVVFSALSRIQSDTVLFHKAYHKIILLFTIAIGLLSVLLFIYSESIITVLYGTQWGESTIYMKLLVVGSYFYIQEMLIRIVFKVFDQTHKILYLEVVKKVIMSATIIVGVILADINVLLYGLISSHFASYCLNLIFSRKLLGIGIDYEISLNIKILCISAMMIVGASFLFNIGLFTDFERFIMLPVVIAFYFLLIRLFQITNILTELREILKIIKRKDD